LKQTKYISKLAFQNKIIKTYIISLEMKFSEHSMFPRKLSETDEIS